MMHSELLLSWLLLRCADASWAQHRIPAFLPFLQWQECRTPPQRRPSRRASRTQLPVATAPVTEPPLNATFTPSCDPVTLGNDVHRIGKTQPGEDRRKADTPHLVVFGALPPSKEEARATLKKTRGKDASHAPPPAPTAVSAGGRLTSVRRLSRTLALGELAPVHPHSVWTSDGNDVLSVQLLLSGPHLGGDSLDPWQGQLVLVRGATQVDNKESLRNWVKKNQLDVNVSSIQPITDSSPWVPRINAVLQDKLPSMLISASHKPKQKGARFLRLDDLYPTSTSSSSSSTHVSDRVTVVDTLALVQEFERCAAQLSRNDSAPTWIGIDCEWKPHTLLQVPTDAQPVLVLQVCLHPLRRIFLLDLSALLRPLQSPAEPLNELEAAVAKVLAELFHDPRILKVGFLLVGDLRRLAASYPHLAEPALGRVEGVVDVARLSRGVLRKIHHQRNARFSSSSLARLVDHHFVRPLDKASQCSDWSQRPWTRAQIDYAALDAAIGPAVLDMFLLPVGEHSKDPPLRIWTDPAVQLGRWRGDASFAESITSWSFRPLPVPPRASTAEEPVAAAPATRRRKQQPPFGNLPPVVTRRWVTGAKAPE